MLVPLAVVAVIFMGVAATGAVMAVRYLEPVWHQYFAKKSPPGDQGDKAKLVNEDKTNQKEEKSSAKDDGFKTDTDGKHDLVKNDVTPKKEEIKKEDVAKSDAVKKEEAPQPGPQVGREDKPLMADNSKKEEKKEVKPEPAPLPEPAPVKKDTTMDKGGIAKNDSPKSDDQKPAPGPTPEPAPAPAPMPPTPPRVEPPAPPKLNTREFHLTQGTQVGGANSVTLAEALEKADEGATIYLAPGTYSGGITIEKTVHLIGENADKEHPALVSFDGGPAVFEVKAKDVSFEHLNLELRKGEAPADGEKQAAKPAVAVVVIQPRASVKLVDCAITNTSSKQGIALRPEAELMATKVAIEGISGPALNLTGGKADLSECVIRSCTSAIVAPHAGPITLKDCVLEKNGLPDGTGAIVILAQDTQGSAEKCTFTGNTGCISVFDKCAFNFTGCTFTENGVTAAPPADKEFNGMLCSGGESKVNFANCTFAKNHQGVAVVNAASSELTDCHFTDTGVKDMKGAKDALGFYSNPIAISGKGATVKLHHCDFAQSVLMAVNVVDGASLIMEDSQINGCGDVAIGVGSPNSAPCSVQIHGSKITGASKALALTAATEGEVADTECSDNEMGVVISDPGTKVSLSKLTAAGNKTIGLWTVANSEVTASDCVFQKSLKGVQLGEPSAGNTKVTTTFERCRFEENETDMFVSIGSLINLKDCTFPPDGKPKVKKEKNALVKADPPIKGVSSGSIASKDVVDNDDESGSGASKKSSGTSSSRSSTPKRKIIRRDPVRDAIDQLNRIKNIFR